MELCARVRLGKVYAYNMPVHMMHTEGKLKRGQGQECQGAEGTKAVWTRRGRGKKRSTEQQGAAGKEGGVQRARNERQGTKAEWIQPDEDDGDKEAQRVENEKIDLRVNDARERGAKSGGEIERRQGGMGKTK